MVGCRLRRSAPPAAQSEVCRVHATVLMKVEWTATESEPRPDVSFVPMLERRRLSSVERAALHVAWKVFRQCEEAGIAGASASETPVVFASRWGEIGTTLNLMRQMHDEGEMSPAGFSNSVHNAAPGHLSLLTKDKAPYTAISAGVDSYEMGMLEASTYPGKVLFVYAEESTPEMYRPHFPDVKRAHSVAVLLDD